MESKYTEAAYQALVEDIFRRFPSVQKDGFSAGAYKPGLERMQAFDEAMGHPSRLFRSIHIAGTNGKGSVANMLASALASCGLRTGLFTSPHLIDFRERIVISGMRSFVANAPQDDSCCHSDSYCHSERSEESSLIPKEYVFSFLTEWMPWITAHQLSFFEITTGLAFKWFADHKVDVAVIETGLGGRLDSTNILEHPELTIVTTIGFDHMAQLGGTLPAIAAEKAGIFKPGVPALVGEWQAETAPVFEAHSPLTFADRVQPTLWERHPSILAAMDLQAAIQEKNLRTVLAAIDLLCPAFPTLSNDEALLRGIIHTARNMGFHGRWERLQERPLVIADIGHNAHALRHNFAQLEAMMQSGSHDALIIVYGIMADKDLAAILPLMPRQATYIFTTPDTPRALPAAEILQRFRGFLQEKAITSVAGEGAECRKSAFSARSATHNPTTDDIPSQVAGFLQTCDTSSLDLQQSREYAFAFPAVADAVKIALALATPDTLIYIGGSTFVVADALPLFQ